jgi:hypothetical protein
MKKIILLITLFLGITNIYAWNIYNTSNSGLPSNNIRGIDFDKQGNTWIATDAGLAKFNGSTWQVFKTSNSGIGSNDIKDVKVDNKNNKWVSTPLGLSKFNDTSWVSYSISNVSKIFIDKNNLLYLIRGNANSSNGNGFSTFDGINSQWYSSGSGANLVSNYIRDIYIDSINQKWIIYDVVGPGSTTSYTKIDTNGVMTNQSLSGPFSYLLKSLDGPDGRKYFITASIIGPNLYSSDITVKTDTGWYHLSSFPGKKFGELLYDFGFDDEGDLWMITNMYQIAKYSLSKQTWDYSAKSPANHINPYKIVFGAGKKWITGYDNSGVINFKCISSFSTNNDSMQHCMKDSIRLNYKGPHSASLWINTNNTQYKNNVSTYVARDTGLYYVYYTNTEGCVNSTPNKYYLTKNFKANIITNKRDQCLNDNNFVLGSTFSEDTTGINVIWNLVKRTDNMKSTTINYDTSGVYRIGLIATSIGGCKDTSDEVLFVKPNATAGPMLGESNALVLSTPYVYTVAQQVNHTYNWTVTNGIIAAGQGTNAATVQWLANGKGSLKVEVTNSQGCSDTTFTQVTVGNVGLYEAGNINSLMVYPNPSNGAFTVSLNAIKSSTVQMSLINLLGQEIWNTEQAIQAGEQTIQINANLAPGVYTLRINNQEEILQHKVLIK